MQRNQEDLNEIQFLSLRMQLERKDLAKNIMQKSNGEYYEGEWVGQNRDGFGIQIWSNGERIEGEWMNNKANGRGKFWLEDGDQFEGDWKDNTVCGKGVYIHVNDSSSMDSELKLGLINQDLRDYIRKGKKKDLGSIIVEMDQYIQEIGVKISNVVMVFTHGLMEGYENLWSLIRNMKGIGLWDKGKMIKLLDQDEQNIDLIPKDWNSLCLTSFGRNIIMIFILIKQFRKYVINLIVKFLLILKIPIALEIRQRDLNVLTYQKHLSILKVKQQIKQFDRHLIQVDEIESVLVKQEIVK